MNAILCSKRCGPLDWFTVTWSGLAVVSMFQGRSLVDYIWRYRIVPDRSPWASVRNDSLVTESSHKHRSDKRKERTVGNRSKFSSSFHLVGFRSNISSFSLNWLFKKIEQPIFHLPITKDSTLLTCDLELVSITH